MLRQPKAFSNLFLEHRFHPTPSSRPICDWWCMIAFHERPDYLLFQLFWRFSFPCLNIAISAPKHAPVFMSCLVKIVFQSAIVSHMRMMLTMLFNNSFAQRFCLPNVIYWAFTFWIVKLDSLLCDQYINTRRSRNFMLIGSPKICNFRWEFFQVFFGQKLQ